MKPKPVQSWRLTLCMLFGGSFEAKLNQTRNRLRRHRSSCSSGLHSTRRGQEHLDKFEHQVNIVYFLE